jgi:hypothetical protein
MSCAGKQGNHGEEVRNGGQEANLPVRGAVCERKEGQEGYQEVVAERCEHAVKPEGAKPLELVERDLVRVMGLNAAINRSLEAGPVPPLGSELVLREGSSLGGCEKIPQSARAVFGIHRFRSPTIRAAMMPGSASTA